jgi:monofunctional biosynthetic peptidoglycan transglycosylase
VLPVPFSAVMLERQVGAWLSGDFHYVAHSDWVAWMRSPVDGAGGDCRRRSEIPGTLGFDVSAIEKALAHNERMKTASRRVNAVAADGEKPVSVGWPQLAAKGLEAGLTVGMETVWSKKRILTVYLNIAEFGDGTFGVEAARSAIFINLPAS